VIVREDNCCGVDRKRPLDDFSRVNAGAVDGTAEQLLERQDAMPVVEVQAAKYLVGSVPQAGQQELFGIRGAADRLAFLQRLLEITARQCRQRFQYGDAEFTEPGLAAKGGIRGMQQRAQTGSRPWLRRWRKERA
jgi:hypothetical protein